MSALTTSMQRGTEVVARAIRQEKETKASHLKNNKVNHLYLQTE